MTNDEATDVIRRTLNHQLVAEWAWQEALNLAIAALEREAKAEPVAWRVRDYGDGWIYTLKDPQRYHEETGAVVQPLYASPVPPAQVRDIPGGWVMAPISATDEMAEAAYGVEVFGADLHDFCAHDRASFVWQAMIAAAPPAPETPI